MNAYIASIFSGFVASPPPIRNTAVSFLLLYFYSISVSAFIPSSVILDVGLPSPQCWPGIVNWYITVLFSSTLISMLSVTGASVHATIQRNSPYKQTVRRFIYNNRWPKILHSLIQKYRRQPQGSTSRPQYIESCLKWPKLRLSLQSRAASWSLQRENAPPLCQEPIHCHVLSATTSPIIGIISFTQLNRYD